MDTGNNIFLFCDFYVIFLYPSPFSTSQTQSYTTIIPCIRRTNPIPYHNTTNNARTRILVKNYGLYIYIYIYIYI